MLAMMLALAAAADQPVLRAGLEPLGFLVGHCWRGDFPNGGGADTHCFDSVYNGQHVRDRHEVVGPKGGYRGETIYSWDGAAKAVRFTYWNSLGGVSRGTMRPEPGRLSFGDESYRGPDGKDVSIATHWRTVGANAYEAVSESAEAPSMNRSVTYRRADDVAMTSFRDADGSHRLAHEVTVDAPAEEVWTAIATPEGWRSWAVPVAWVPDGEPDAIETSYTSTARPGDASTIRQAFIARLPGRTLVFRTTKAPAGFPHFDTFSRVTHFFELEPLGERRTRVRLTGVGYADTEAGRALLGFFRDGNRVSLERLRSRFAAGPIDWAAAQASGK